MRRGSTGPTRAGGERGLDRRKGGQIHVCRRRSHRGEEAEQQGEPGGEAHPAFIADGVPDGRRGFPFASWRPVARGD